MRVFLECMCDQTHDPSNGEDRRGRIAAQAHHVAQGGQGEVRVGCRQSKLAGGVYERVDPLGAGRLSRNGWDALE